MCEDGHHIVTGDNKVTQAQRFADVPSAMPYTLVLLSGDYPLLDFTLWGRATCFLMCLFAVSVVSVPSSIIASGFTDVAMRARSARSKNAGKEKPAAGEAPEPTYLHDNSFGDNIHALLSPGDDTAVRPAPRRRTARLTTRLTAFPAGVV
jgi:hypothetical protein